MKIGTYLKYIPEEEAWFKESLKLEELKNRKYEIGLSEILGARYGILPNGNLGLSLRIPDLYGGVVYLPRKKDIKELFKQTKTRVVEDLVGIVVELIQEDKLNTAGIRIKEKQNTRYSCWNKNTSRI